MILAQECLPRKLLSSRILQLQTGASFAPECMHEPNVNFTIVQVLVACICDIADTTALPCPAIRYDRITPPSNKKNPTTSTWHHQRWAITISLTINLVIVWCCCHVLVVGFFIFKDGARFTSCFINPFKFHLHHTSFFNSDGHTVWIKQPSLKGNPHLKGNLCLTT